MEATFKKPAPPRGFTLVEMLVVVAIIAILAGLITAAAIRARTTARQAAIKLEIDQLAEAIGAYKAKFGDYPPDFTDPAAVQRHFAKAFPRCKAAIPTGYDAASGIVFCLGGMPDPNNDKKLTGFSANPENPFDNSPSRIEPFFDFDQRRLGTGKARKLVYYPKIGKPDPASPYVYFRSRPGGVYGPRPERTQFFEPPEGSKVMPYYDALVEDWVNPKGFQILSAGLDDRFGSDNNYRSDEKYDESNYDDIHSFCEKTTLEGDLP